MQNPDRPLSEGLEILVKRGENIINAAGLRIIVPLTREIMKNIKSHEALVDIAGILSLSADIHERFDDHKYSLFSNQAVTAESLQKQMRLSGNKKSTRPSHLLGNSSP